MPILATMGKREARGVRKAVGRPVHDFGNHRQGAHCTRSNARNEEEFREVYWATIRRCS